MKPASLPPAYAEARARFGAIDGQVHYFAFDAEGREGLELHREATLAAYEALCEELDPARRFMTSDFTKLRATSVDPSELRRPVSSSAGSFMEPGPYLAARERSLKERGAFSSGGNGEYVYAFAAPPYGLRAGPEEVQALFEALNEHLFGGFRDELELYVWSTDWSTWFRAGLEWWGAHWWTVHNRTRDLLVVLAASATD